MCAGASRRRSTTGDLVCISAAVQNRLPELFDEPDSFNPDRFNKMDGDQGAETR